MPWRNLLSVHHRWMAGFLRRRGWVCFYLEEPARICSSACWLRLYEDGEGRRLK